MRWPWQRRDAGGDFSDAGMAARLRRSAATVRGWIRNLLQRMPSDECYEGVLDHL